MANSQTDMDDWVKAIRRVIWAPFGGGELKHELLSHLLRVAQCKNGRGTVGLAKKEQSSIKMVLTHQHQSLDAPV